MKKLVLLAVLFVAFLFSSANGFAAETEVKNVFDIEYETTDNFIMKSKLTYPNEQKNMYPLVVLLHSLGYSSEHWGSLKSDFMAAGVAVLEIDLKGHGQSSTDAYFKRRSWIYFNDKAFQLYPEEVLAIVNLVLDEHKNISANHVSYVGADIGANVAIWVSALSKVKPVCLMLISPHVEFKGLYAPIKLANAGNVPILAIAAQKDFVSVKQLDELKKYAQGDYKTKIYPNGGTGMLMLKVNKDMHYDIVNWAVERLNEKI